MLTSHSGICSNGVSTHRGTPEHTVLVLTCFDTSPYNFKVHATQTNFDIFLPWSQERRRFRASTTRE